MRPSFAAVLLLAPILGLPRPAGADPPARQLFGAVQTPAALPPSAIGTPVKGCLAGAQALPSDGPHWQVMRPSRHRYFGHPNLVSYIEHLSEVAAGEGWPGLLVGDMAQPRGGPMTSGHASHQTGIDVDLWLKPAPDHPLNMEERENLPLVSVLKPGTRELDPELWSDQQARFIKRAASEPEVARIFVNPAIKKALCDGADRLGSDRAWVRLVRPWWRHDDHIHVRLKCPDPACVEQAPPPVGDGCGAELTKWLSRKPRPVSKPHPGPSFSVRSLPLACRAVLSAPALDASAEQMQERQPDRVPPGPNLLPRS
jgi:penicillin-insensitive murein endopeptidase